VLDEYGIEARDDDREVLGEIVSPAGEWAWGQQTCPYVTTMIDRWGADTPAGRHPWLISQAVRLACARRLGCITENDHHAATHSLADRFAWLCANTQVWREIPPGERGDALSWAVAKAATFTEDRARRELGDHRHTKANEAAVEELARGDSDRAVTLLDELEAIALTSDEIKAMPPAEAVIDGWLMRNSLAMLYGPSGGGKTFLAFDWSFHIATGSWWHGQEVKGGPVVYVIAEGVGAAGPRIGFPGGSTSSISPRPPYSPNSSPHVLPPLS
jgi:hypothetical protein